MMNIPYSEAYAEDGACSHMLCRPTFSASESLSSPYKHELNNAKPS